MRNKYLHQHNNNGENNLPMAVKAQTLLVIGVIERVIVRLKYWNK